MSKLSPVRDDTLKSPDATRVMLNTMVKAINGQTGSRTRVMRIDNVQAGMAVVLNSPGFTVGAAVVGGVSATNGGTAPVAAPYVERLEQLPDGRLSMTIGALPAAPSLYAVRLVLFEQGA
jgi:hypothetical protein